MISIAPVRKSIVVQADSALAFEIFTKEIDTWWPQSHSMGGTPFKLSIIEPFIGGRWYAQRQDGSEVNIAHVTAWEPSRRVVFRWEIGAEFAPNPDQASELEVRFVSLGAGATRVELEHRDFGRISAGAEAYRNQLDQGWPAALGQFAMACRHQTRSVLPK
jgi:hypothetical protein